MNLTRLTGLFILFYCLTFFLILACLLGTHLENLEGTVHLGGLRSPLALYLGLLVAHPRVVTRLRSELGSHFMIFSYGLPQGASLYERAARRRHGERGASAQ